MPRFENYVILKCLSFYLIYIICQVRYTYFVTRLTQTWSQIAFIKAEKSSLFHKLTSGDLPKLV